MITNTQETPCPITNNTSEVAACLQAIEAEYTASQRGLHAYAETSRHAFITARMERIGKHAETLTILIGNTDQAMALVVDRLNQIQGEEHHAS